MLRHAIPPAARFSQIPNEILRHPHLNADAVRLLAWQLSLPDGVDEPLSRTAGRAGLGKLAFLRAKGQLKAAGYVHEWREQVERGRWRTRQLVSNVPLSPAEAALVRSPEAGTVRPGEATPADSATDGTPTDHTPGSTPGLPLPADPPLTNSTPAPAGTVPPTPAPPGGVPPGVVPPEAVPPTAAPPGVVPPTADLPAAGGPMVRSVGRHPRKTSGGNTSHPPAPPEARRAVEDLTSLDPRLRMAPRAMFPELAGLAARWLAAGHSAESLRSAVARSLPARGELVHHPGGLLRYILREVPPPSGPATPPPPVVATMRECTGARHVQPMLFRPLADEELCGPCRTEHPAPPARSLGATLARTALRTATGT
ncbi:hypothetical protein ACE1OA_12440 [Streptomyces sp. JL2001]|uniref:hypothetical protein n=1 Tax=Streptomyces sp. JL2001 TaxID=3342488 RepID=UPI003D803EBF